MLTKHFMLHNFFKNKNISKKLKLRLKDTIIDKNVNVYIRNLDTNKEIESNWTFLKGKCI